MKVVLCILLILLGLTTLAKDNDYSIEIDQGHLNELVEDNDAAFEPIGVKELKVDEESFLDGVVKRFQVSYSQIAASETGSTFRVNRRDEDTYDLSSSDMDAFLEENLEFKNGHIFSVEYLVTDNFSVELADTYRNYQMDGKNVGHANEEFLAQYGDSSKDYSYSEKVHDIRVGVKYSIKMVNTRRFKFQISPGVSAGIVHLKAKSKYSQNGIERERDYYDDIGGYSYGVSLEAKAIFWDNFFINIGVEDRNFVIAPMEHESGFSHQIDQEGFNVYIGAGIRF